MQKATLAALLAGLPALAHGQQPAQVPAIIRANAASAAGSSAGGSSIATARVSVGPPGTQLASNAVPATMPPPIRLLSPSARLNAKEKRGVALAHRWAAARYMPHAGADGVIRFAFGATLPTVVCAPLQVCDLALQPGEVVNNVNLGDKVRWNVSPALSGSPAGQVTHLIIKPDDAGLVSSMTIETNRRTYAVKLVSTQRAWMPLIAFTYRDDTQSKWAAYRQTVGFSAMSGGASGFGASAAGSAAGLDFGFRITGDSPAWRPLRVYSDGRQTFIQFPHTMTFGDAPALVGLDSNGGWFSRASPQMVNYRLLGDRYVVDKVLDRAELVSGVGAGQTRVLITREAAR